MFRKYRIKNKIRFTAFMSAVILIVVCASSAFLGLSSASASDVDPFVEVRVSYGDTLWSLARQYGPDKADIRGTIYEICRINHVTAETLQAGQHILIPTT